MIRMRAPNNGVTCTGTCWPPSPDSQSAQSSETHCWLLQETSSQVLNCDSRHHHCFSNVNCRLSNVNRVTLLLQPYTRQTPDAQFSHWTSLVMLNCDTGHHQGSKTTGDKRNLSSVDWWLVTVDTRWGSSYCITTEAVKYTHYEICTAWIMASCLFIATTHHRPSTCVSILLRKGKW